MTIYFNMLCAYSWYTGLAAICNAAWLSQNSFAGQMLVTYKSFKRKRNHVNSHVVAAIDLSYASADDRNTFFLFLCLP